MISVKEGMGHLDRNLRCDFRLTSHRIILLVFMTQRIPIFTTVSLPPIRYAVYGRTRVTWYYLCNHKKNYECSCHSQGHKIDTRAQHYAHPNTPFRRNWSFTRTRFKREKAKRCLARHIPSCTATRVPHHSAPDRAQGGGRAGVEGMRVWPRGWWVKKVKWLTNRMVMTNVPRETGLRNCELPWKAIIFFSYNNS